MILSHKCKFIFIKTAKTAGTSTEVFLSKYCGPTDVLTPITPPIEGHQPRNCQGFINPIPEIVERPGKFFSALRHTLTSREKFYRHMPAFEVQQRVPSRVWNSYFKFCVERNPWDKVLSHYHMHAAREGGALSLDEYLARGRFPINYFRYTDRSGRKILVDRVLRHCEVPGDSRPGQRSRRGLGGRRTGQRYSRVQRFPDRHRQGLCAVERAGARQAHELLIRRLGRAHQRVYARLDALWRDPTPGRRTRCWVSP